MQRRIIPGIAIVILLLLGWFGLRLWRQLAPAFGPPPQDIVKIIEEREAQKRTLPIPPGEPTEFPLKLPEGFSISIFAKGLDKVRVLAHDPDGVVLASIPAQGKVVALPDADRDGKTDAVVDVLTGLARPHGLAFLNNDLYVAETDKIVAYHYAKRSATDPRVIATLPGGGDHWSRTIGAGPDGKLYVTMGSSCNVCKERDKRRAAMLRMNPDGSTEEIFASGLRNTVFFVWRPGIEELWGNDMGRDWLGDDFPPDEINIIKEGKFYGWPYCYGKNVNDPFGGKSSQTICANAEPSHYDLPAHVAPLGLRFYTGSLFPQEYRGNLFISLHGSWNRSVPTGYSVARFILDEKGNITRGEDFISGWLSEGGALGRPVDILQDTDGSLLISDDKAGVVYRVTYST